jgi:hypothetical protein
MDTEIAYTVSRCRKDNTLYGKVHGSDDSTTTLCGLDIDSSWWVITNNGFGEITCKKCLK